MPIHYHNTTTTGHPTVLQPKFSIITVCRNAQTTIEDTLQSVITQGYHHVEYIVIDGNSTDGTLSIIRRYQEHIAHVVSEPDKGLYDAMNKGLRLATGDYVCFLNAGDCFHEDDTLLQIVHHLHAAGLKELPDVIYGETQLVDGEGHFVRMRRLSTPEKLTWKSFRHGMLVCHQAFFAKRTLAPAYDTSYRFSADFDWCIRVMKQSKQLFNTHLTLIDYLSEGMTTRNHRASLKERFRIMCHHYGYCSTLLMHAWFVVRLILKK
ncbi:MAG: glycosyltransferase family 2 protein [Bacteroides sp.]